MTNPIACEIGKWSELPSFIEQYNHLIHSQGDGIGRIFGYASIIGNHSAEKPAQSANIPNEKATLHGMEVAMNVYAAGQYEYRGTRDLENGIYNVGLYAGMEPALTEDGYAEGLNITVAPEDAAQSFKAYLKREIGNPPGDVDLDNLITQGENGEILITEEGKAYFSTLADSEKDDFGLYKLQVVNVTLDNNQVVPALSVSTNEKSPFSAIGLTPIQAAHYILDGQGYEREVDGRALGGSAVDYFQNTLASYEEFGVNQPRMREIAGSVIGMAEAYQAFDAAQKDSSKQAELPDIASRLLNDAFTTELNGEKHFVSTRRFDDDLVDRGQPTENVRQSNDLPRNGTDKISRISGLLEDGALDEIRSVAETLKKADTQEGISEQPATHATSNITPSKGRDGSFQR